jgi:hypothetical protein|nr:sialidase family protein [Kofleriaceae bacterium]
MRGAWLFTVAACAGSAAPHAQPIAPAPPPPSSPPIVVDAAPPPIDAAPVPQVGDACRASACGDGQTCIASWTGGYCELPCTADRACAGRGEACVATPRLGDVCARACERDDDCRVDDGYLCDATWHACLLPNTAAIEARACAGSGGAGSAWAALDRSFGSASELPLLGDAGAIVATSDGSALPPRASRSPALALLASGSAVAIAPGAESPFADAIVGDEPALASLGSDTLAAWVRAGAEHRTLVVASARTGVTPGVEADDCAGDASCPARPRLAAASGTSHAVYLAYSGDAIGTRVRVAPSADAPFGHATTALVGARGDLAVSTDGRVHVIAMRGGTGGAYGAAQHAIEYTVSKDGARTFARPSLVSARDELIPAYFASPSLAVDDRRNVIYVAYVRGATDGAWDVVIAASKDKGVTWTRSALGDGCSLRANPSLAVDPTTGTLHVLYADGRADAARAVHATCLPGAQRCGDRGALALAPGDAVVAFDTGRDDARWIGDQTALAVDDKRRTVTAAFALPVAVDGHVVARVFTARAKL